MSAIVVNDQIVHYEVLGRGRPVILLHGWVGSWRYWIPTMQAISSEYRAYALDFWGFGDSAHADTHYSLDGQAELVHEFMDRLGIPKAVFVGHSFGGLVTAQIAGRHPERVERMMLVNVPMIDEALHPRLVRATASDLAEWLLGRGAGTEPIHVEVAKTDPRALQEWFPPEGSDWKPNFMNLRAPCLLVQSLKDPAIQNEGLEDRIGDPGKNHWIEFEDSGHFPMLDNQAAFCRLLLDFLALPSGEPVARLQLKEEWKRRVR
jgi:pimeloyl-ACP methyl ester carboxylesterase